MLKIFNQAHINKKFNKISNLKVILSVKKDLLNTNQTNKLLQRIGIFISSPDMHFAYQIAAKLTKMVNRKLKHIHLNSYQNIYHQIKMIVVVVKGRLEAFIKDKLKENLFNK